MSDYNVYDAFLYKNKLFIIAITYYPDLNIDPIVQEISKPFNLAQLYLKSTDLTDITKYDFESLNNNITRLITASESKLQLNQRGYFGQGIIIIGNILPFEKISKKIDIHIHIDTNISHLKTLKSDYDEQKFNTFKTFFTSINQKIHKYINLKSEINDSIIDQVFNKIIDYIEHSVYKDSYDTYATNNPKMPNITVPIAINASDSIDITDKSSESIEDDKIEDVINTSSSDITEASISDSILSSSLEEFDGYNNLRLEHEILHNNLKLDMNKFYIHIDDILYNLYMDKYRLKKLV